VFRAIAALVLASTTSHSTATLSSAVPWWERVTVTVSLEVMEGTNAPFLYTQAMKEVMSLLNLANIGDIANTIVPA